MAPRANKGMRSIQPLLSTLEKTLVAAEQLVATIAGEANFHMARSKLRNQIRGDGGHVAEGLIEVAHKSRDQVDANRGEPGSRDGRCRNGGQPGRHRGVR